MNLIAAVDRNWAIGNKGKLLVRIPNDHKMFRQETLDKVVVYGRKTLETFPLSQPLDRRENIILSHNPDLQVRNARVVHSVEELRPQRRGTSGGLWTIRLQRCLYHRRRQRIPAASALL